MPLEAVADSLRRLLLFTGPPAFIAGQSAACSSYGLLNSEPMIFEH